MHDWSLEKEVCELAGASDFRDALYKLHLLTARDANFSLEQDEQWVRGGSETYSYRFWISNQYNQKSGYIVKACVAFNPAGTLEEIFGTWVSRRQLLSSHGISTPLLIACGKAVLIEELIPRVFQDVLDDSRDQTRLLASLAEWAGVLARLGFAPLGPFNDLRSRGEDLVAVDFGEDLGPPNIGGNSFELYEKMLGYLHSCNVAVTDSQMADLYDVYISCLDIS